MLGLNKLQCLLSKMNEISKRKMWISNTNEKEQMLPQPLSTLTRGFEFLGQPIKITFFFLNLKKKN